MIVAVIIPHHFGHPVQHNAVYGSHYTVYCIVQFSRRFFASLITFIHGLDNHSPHVPLTTHPCIMSHSFHVTTQTCSHESLPSCTTNPLYKLLSIIPIIPPTHKSYNSSSKTSSMCIVYLLITPLMPL